MKTNIKRKRYQTKRWKNQKAMWKLLIAVTLGSATAIIFPFALDVMQPTAHFPQANVVKELVKAETVNTTVDKSETVEQTIRRIAKETGFKWEEYLVRLAVCESHLNPHAINERNNNPSFSKDRGLFQISDYWHKEVSDEVAFSVESSTRWAIDKINKGGQGIWVCDKYIRANPSKYNPK